MHARQVLEQRREQFAVVFLGGVLGEGVTGTDFLRDLAGQVVRADGARQAVHRVGAFLVAVLGAHGGQQVAGRQRHHLAVEVERVVAARVAVVGVVAGGDRGKACDGRGRLRVEEVQRRATGNRRAGRAAGRHTTAIEEGRTGGRGDQRLQVVAIDGLVLVEVTGAHVEVPLPAGVEQLAPQAGVEHRAVGDHAAVTRADRFQAQAQVRVVAGDAAEVDAERVVQVLRRDDDVVRHGIEGQCGNLVARLRAVVHRFEVGLDAVSDLVVGQREEAAALLRGHQQVQRLVVVQVARGREAAVVRERAASGAGLAGNARAAAVLRILRIRQVDATRWGTAGAALLHRTAVQVQGVAREVAVVGRDGILAVVVRADQDAELVGGRAHRGAGRRAGAVAAARAAVLHADIGAVPLLLGDEVDHAGDGVRAVDGASAFLQHIDALDQVDRDDVDVDRGGRRVAVDADAAAVEQHEGALGAQATQFDVRLARAAAVVHLRVAGRAGNGGNLLQQVTEGGDARALDGCRIDREHRAGGLGVDAPHARAGDHDFVERVSGLVGGLGLGDLVGAGDRAGQHGVACRALGERFTARGVEVPCHERLLQ